MGWQKAVLLVAAARVASGEVMSKFSLRNLSEGPIGVWWIEAGSQRLVPQAPSTIRHTSAIEINSFRGHRFLVRPMAKGALGEARYAPRAGDAVLEVGGTNDLVVFTADRELVKRDARFRVRAAAARAFGACEGAAGSGCAAAALTADLAAWRAAWLEEEALRGEGKGRGPCPST